MLLSVGAEWLTYGLEEDASLQAVDIAHAADGTYFRLISPYGEYTVNTRLVGLFNVYNSLAAIGASFGMCISTEAAISAITDYEVVTGRM